MTDSYIQEKRDKLALFDSFLFAPPDNTPGIELTRAIVAVASQKRNPLQFDLFARVYANAVRCLDPASHLRTCITAYFSQPEYTDEVMTVIGQYNGKTARSKTKHASRGGFMHPYRVYSPVEIMYKWTVSVMMATFRAVLEEIIQVHKYAAVVNFCIRGRGCDSINDGSDNFAKFASVYESRYMRPYLADQLASAEFAHEYTLRFLGSHTKKDGVTAQNLPKDCPNYTSTVVANLDCLDLVKRKINCSYSVPRIRNSELRFVRPTEPLPPVPPVQSPARTPSPESSSGTSTRTSSSSSLSSSISSSYTNDQQPNPIKITISGGTVTINLCDCFHN